MKGMHQGRLVALVATAVLSMCVAGPVSAATWSDPVQVGNAGSGDLIALSNSTLVAVYMQSSGTDEHRIVAQRSTNGGATWAAPVELAVSRDGLDLTTLSTPKVAGFGSNVDVVWAWGNSIQYARSTDAGVTFDVASTLASPKRGSATGASVARTSNGVVAVAWARHRAGIDRVQARISRDGGESFLRAGVITDGLEPMLAAGGSAIHLLYTKGYAVAGGKLRVRSSADSGRTWSAATPIADDSLTWTSPDIAAEGSTAVVTYTAMTPSESTYWVRARRTRNSGATWSAPVNVSPKYGRDGLAPVVTVKDGRAHFAFTRCHPAECDGSGGTNFVVFYRRSGNWPNLRPAEQVTTTDGDSIPNSIAVTTRAIVMYDGTMVRWRE